MKTKEDIVRLKPLLIVLAVLIIALGATLYFYWPFASADRPVRVSSLTLSASPTSVKANNTDQSTITATLTCGRKSGNIGVPITFVTTFGTLSATTAVTNSSCQAQTSLKSAQIGTATITAKGANLITKTEVTFTDPADTAMLSDDFSATLAKWVQVYNGYGTIAIENGELSMAPKASTQPTETHAPLVVAGLNTWGDYVFESRMKTVSQLRTGSTPNAWEVGWLIFRYSDDNHFYYFTQKPNGIELGKEIVNASGAQDQQYLVTETTPVLQLNQWNNYKIILKGANIKVYVNDILVADYTDTTDPYLTGKVGLYNEDAHTHHDDVKVTTN